MESPADENVNGIEIHPATSETINTLETLTQNVAAPKNQEPNRHWRKKEVSTCIPPYTGKAEGK